MAPNPLMDQETDDGSSDPTASRTETDGRVAWTDSPPPRPVPPGLHLVSVPIGALRDITLRALDTLAAADIIACEDTRVTGKLLAAFGMKRPLIAYHDHNAAKIRPGLLARLARGEIVALVSDAGTPLLSDPGYRLVSEAVAEGHSVTAAPGASAALPALQLSALPSSSFLFLGFLPPKKGDRAALLAGVMGVRATLLIYEAPSRLAATLDALAEQLGPRDAAVARELTKRHEEIRRGTLAGLASHYRDAGPPKGELVVAIGPPKGDDAPHEDEVDELLHAALADLSVKEAASQVAASTGLRRRDLYQRALQLKAEE